MDFPTFIGGSYVSQALTADQEETYNYYPERMESDGATTRMALYPVPGISMLATGSGGMGRGHLFINKREFAVIGTTFYEISSAGALTSRGSVAIDSNPATISSNGDGGNQLFITSGSNGYVYDLSANTLTQITFLTGKATMGDHLDGFFLALNAKTSTFYISNLLDGTTWDSTQFAQRSKAPDKWVALKVSAPFIWLFGNQTSEVWYNTGAFPFPFAPHTSGLIPYGILAPFSPAIVGSEMMWLGGGKGGGGNVYSAAGFTPNEVASYSMQNAIDNYSTLVDAVADTYSDRGHTFYLLNFLTEDVTWAWDIETRLWTKRGVWIAEENRFGAYRPRFHADAFHQHRWLDSKSGAIYVFAADGTDVDSRPIRRIRRSPALMGQNARITYSGFELDLEPGLGTSTGQGSDPQVMLRLSNDGGKTWGPEMMRSSGKIGEFYKRLRWNRCGMARRRVFEVVSTDPVPYRLTNAYLTPDPVWEAGAQKQ